jgi:hypothetical protein
MPTTSNDNPQHSEQTDESCRPACPVCGGHLIEIRAKLVCHECHQICEICCEGGRAD